MHDRGNEHSNGGITVQDIAVSEARVQSDVLTIAGLLGREIARKHFERLEAVDDDPPIGEPGDREER